MTRKARHFETPSPGDLSASLAANLRQACSYHASVSDVCRKIGINRAQFMRYLAAEAFPSRRNLRRICDYFGCDEHEMLMAPERFTDLLRLRPRHRADGIDVPPLILDLLGAAHRQQARLSKMIGYYYQYYSSFSAPGHILQALVSIYALGSLTAYKRIERLRMSDLGRPPDVFKYAGLVVLVGDRVHMLDQETITFSELSQTILFPTYRNKVTTLTGLTMGVSGNDAHQPSASRVVLHYLGRTVDLRKAIAGCRLHAADSEAVPALVKSYLRDRPEGFTNAVSRAEML